jgi:hypothetical protein
MEKLIILNIFIYITVLLLSLLIILISKRGYLTLRFKNYCLTNTLEEFIVLLFIISGIIMFILYLFLYILTPALYGLINDNSGFLYMVNDTNSNTQDPVRWWPSGTPQSWGILGTALGIYRLVPGNSRVKAMAALGSLGITIPSTVYFHAVENPNGFNRLMYSWMKYKQNGSWPSNISNQIQDDELKDIIPNVISEGENKYDLVKNSTSSILPKDLNNFFDNIIPDNIFSFILDFFRPVPVVGYLDDLIGQQLFIHLLLFIIVLSLIVLLNIYFFIQIMLNNKEFIIKKFNNKIILFIIKYQLFIAKITSIVLPLLIMFGLIELLVGLYFILTHPIPYDKLDIDLHTFLK